MITLKQQIECVDRELDRRKRAYPSMVEAGKMNQNKAENEIEVMESIRNSLLLLPHETSLIEPFTKT